VTPAWSQVSLTGLPALSPLADPLRNVSDGTGTGAVSCADIADKSLNSAPSLSQNGVLEPAYSRSRRNKADQEMQTSQQHTPARSRNLLQAN